MPGFPLYFREPHARLLLRGWLSFVSLYYYFLFFICFHCQVAHLLLVSCHQLSQFHGTHHTKFLSIGLIKMKRICFICVLGFVYLERRLSRNNKKLIIIIITSEVVDKAVFKLKWRRHTRFYIHYGSCSEQRYILITERINYTLHDLYCDSIFNLLIYINVCIFTAYMYMIREVIVKEYFTHLINN